MLTFAVFADQVVLTNGDKITGAIVQKDGDKLTIKSPLLGDVTMPWSAVTSVNSDTTVFVAPKSGGEVSGKLSTSGQTLEISGAQQHTVPLNDVAALRGPAAEKKFERLQSPGWLDLWAGAFDLGFALTRGNSKTENLTTAFNAARVTRNDKTTIHYDQVYATATVDGMNAATAQSWRAGISYDHNLSPRLFVNAMNRYEHDRFQNLDLRFLAGGGSGVHVIKSDQTSLDALGGLDYNRENYTNGLTRNSIEAYFGNDLAYKVSGATALTQSFRVFPNLTSTGEYRFSFDLGTATTLRKWLSWQVSASDRFISNPVFGHERNDLVLTTGVRASFAR